MSNKAWPMEEEDKIKIGKYIIGTILADGNFPATAAAGKQLLLDMGVVFEGDVYGVLFHENDANGLMHIAIPPREAVKEKYEYNKEDKEYVLKKEYEIPDTYTNIAKRESKLSNKEAYQFRIGDYTISHCG